jgi:predicted DNA-binding transcriptional regulator YafY
MYSEDSPKRFDRIVAILTHLQSKKIVKAQELADRFEVSLRTIYRDIRSLEASGVPIYGEPGVGYSLVDGYKLPPVMFTREEAASFIAAEKLMEKFTDENMKNHFQSAVFKVKSVLRRDEKDWIESIESRVKITDRTPELPENSPIVLNALFESIAQKIQLQMVYQSLESDAPSQRNIEPVGIYHENNFWYLLAYCHLRKDYRNFRTDRILRLQKTSILFEREHRELDYYLKKEDPKEQSIIRFHVSRKVAPYLQNDRKYYGFISEERKGDVVEMIFRGNFKENGIARWILMFGDYLEVLEPQELKDYTLELLEKVKVKLK